MNNFSQLGLEDSHYEHTLRVREKAEIRTVAKFIGVAYLICIIVPEIFSYFIIDLAKSYRSLGFLLRIFSEPIPMMIYQTIISSLAFTLPFLVIPIGLNIKTKKLVSFGRPKNGLTIAMTFLGLGFCAFANIAANTISEIFASFGVLVYSPSFADSKTAPEFLLTFLAVAIVPAIVEEFAFRGIILGSLRKFGDGFAILISSLVFGLIHQNFAQMPFAFLVGIVLAFATIKTGSVITSVIIHFLNNALSLIISTATSNMGQNEMSTVIFSMYFALCFILFFIGVALICKKGKEAWKPARTTHKLTSKQRFNCFFSQPVVIFCTVLTIITAVGQLVIKR